MKPLLLLIALLTGCTDMSRSNWPYWMPGATYHPEVRTWLKEQRGNDSTALMTDREDMLWDH